jgi:hypothetical protein
MGTLSLKARVDTGCKRKLPNDESIVIFVLHKPRLSGANSAIADATPSRSARPTQAAADIRDARLRRLPMAVVAERAFTSRSTLQKVEAGNANVSIGVKGEIR